jgi:hypothetical protein
MCMSSSNHRRSRVQQLEEVRERKSIRTCPRRASLRLDSSYDNRLCLRLVLALELRLAPEEFAGSARPFPPVSNVGWTTVLSPLSFPRWTKI